MGITFIYINTKKICQILSRYISTEDQRKLLCYWQ